jgi:UDPglucose--hexose-1-phosphate uridylyltransferase
VAVAPFASGVPYETWITPRTHRPSFASLEDGEIREVADLLREVVGALRHGAGDPDYNLVIHSAPAGEETKPFFLWHLRVLPRIVTPAGFELGSGVGVSAAPILISPRPYTWLRTLRMGTAKGDEGG